mgnify:CR=1 FL=1
MARTPTVTRDQVPEKFRDAFDAETSDNGAPIDSGPGSAMIHSPEMRRRANHLVKSLDGPSDAEVKDMPQVFLMEVLEWNEALEEARASDPGSPQREAAFGIKPDLEAQRSEHIAAITELLDPLPDSGGLSGVLLRCLRCRHLG